MVFKETVDDAEEESEAWKTEKEMFSLSFTQ